MKRMTVVAILVLVMVRLALLTANAQAGATEYRINLTATPHGAPICYNFDDWGRSTRALTRLDGAFWYVQIPTSHSFVLFCEGYEWVRIPNTPSITLESSRIDSQMVYEDVNRAPHTVEATVCRQAPRLGISFCYDAIVSIDADNDGARFWVNTSTSWYVTRLRIDGQTFNEYTLLTRTPDGRVITDPSDPSRLSPRCVSFDGMGHADTAIRPRWEERLHSWRIRISETYHYALYCDDRQIAVIEDADRGMPGAVLILDTAPMSTVQLHRVVGHEDATVSAVICTSPTSEWTRWQGTYCYSAEVWTESDGSFTEWYTNVTDGWQMTVMVSGQSTSVRVGR